MIGWFDEASAPQQPIALIVPGHFAFDVLSAGLLRQHHSAGAGQRCSHANAILNYIYCCGPNLL